jgi:DNA repair protein RadC
METIGNTRIQDIPISQRPREKLSQYGASSLNNAELISLFIATGNRGSSSIDIGRSLLNKYGGLGALGTMPAGILAQEAGIGPAKAAALAAAYELGARVAREQINSVTLDRPEEIYQYFAPQLQHLSHEQVIVVSLDTRLRHVSTTVVSIGTVNEAHAHPREILRPVIARAAYAFILIHNHPSGDPSPSRADFRITEQVVKAAEIMQIQLVDHVIVGRAEQGRQPFYSFRESGHIP